MQTRDTDSGRTEAKTLKMKLVNCFVVNFARENFNVTKKKNRLNLMNMSKNNNLKTKKTGEK